MIMNEHSVLSMLGQLVQGGDKLKSLWKELLLACIDEAVGISDGRISHMDHFPNLCKCKGRGGS